MTLKILASFLRWVGIKRGLYLGAKQFLRRYGFDITRYNSEPLGILPLAVHLVIDNVGSDNFFFIQIGANDGIMVDPIRPLMEKYGFKGLLVEPLPDIFESLKDNYQGYTGLVFVNAAISVRSGELQLYRFRREANIEEWFHGLATGDEKKLQFQARRWGLDPKTAIEKVVVPAITYRELLAKHNISRFNLLQIDTEGYDYEVLRMALAHDCRPEIIHFENALLSIGDKRLSEELLRSKGYSYLDEGGDTVALSNTTLADAPNQSMLAKTIGRPKPKPRRWSGS